MDHSRANSGGLLRVGAWSEDCSDCVGWVAWRGEVGG